VDDLLSAGKTADYSRGFDHDQCAVGLKDFFNKNFYRVDTFVLGLLLGLLRHKLFLVHGAVGRGVYRIILRFFLFYRTRSLRCFSSADYLLVRAFVLYKLVQRSQPEKRSLVAGLILQQWYN